MESLGDCDDLEGVDLVDYEADFRNPCGMYPEVSVNLSQSH